MPHLNINTTLRKLAIQKMFAVLTVTNLGSMVKSISYFFPVHLGCLALKGNQKEWHYFRKTYGTPWPGCLFNLFEVCGSSWVGVEYLSRGPAVDVPRAHRQSCKSHGAQKPWDSSSTRVLSGFLSNFSPRL